VTSVRVKSSHLNSKGDGERVGGAIGEVEPRLRIDAFAVTIERRERFARLSLVEGMISKFMEWKPERRSPLRPQFT
jgi:hypothetical protein